MCTEASLDSALTPSIAFPMAVVNIYENGARGADWDFVYTLIRLKLKDERREAGKKSTLELISSS